ncbi:MAG: hypothetical protein QXD48_01400 [Candidatus Aenigmatarchaeota archaeon]
MKKIIIGFLVILTFITPVFAGGNLTINGTSLAPAYVNTNSSVEMLRLYLNVTPGSGDDTVNVTLINITLAGTATTGNISAVEIRNLTDVLGANTTWNTTLNKITIRFINGLFINASTNTTITIVFNISSTATRLATVAANLNVSTDVGTSEDDDNITVGETNMSIESQIQDVHAIASISPRFVDTNVTNQSFVYSIIPTGNDTFTIINITIPIGYTITDVKEVRNSAGVIYNSTYQSAGVTFTDNKININYSIGFTISGGIISISFTANTNSSQISSATFDSKISGSNLTYVNTTIATTGATNVTTKQLFIIQNVTIIKSTAIVNDTDYWEFNFTLNFTVDVTGLLQFRMNNWNNTEGNILNLTNQDETRYYASLRLGTDPSNTFNVTNNYNITQGINLVATENTLYYIILKMIIPSGTPISSTWWTTYYTLFRSIP